LVHTLRLAWTYAPPSGKVQGQGGGWRDESISGCGLARDHTPRPGLKQSLVAAKGLHWEKAMKELLRELKIKIVEELQLKEVNPDELADDTAFFDGGLGLDSVDLLVLVALVDRDYGVEIFSRELGEKVFITLSTLAAYIAEMKQRN